MVVPSPSSALAWTAHLRAGGTRPWQEFRTSNPAPDPAPARETAPAGPGPGIVPGAQQLELVRRLNLAGRPAAALVDRLLATPAPGRGQPELDLVGAGQDRAYGRRPVDPAQLDARELLRVALAVIADELAAGRLGSAEVPVRPRTRPHLRSFRVGGDPWLAAYARDALAARGRPPGGPGLAGPVAILLGRDVPGMISDAWAFRCFHDGVAPWEEWLARAVRRRALPPRADLARNAAWWVRRLGADRVHVALGEDGQRRALAELVGVRRPLPDPPRPSATAAELARRTHPALGVRVPDDGLRRRLLRRALAPRLARVAPGDGPVVPAEHRDWLAARAAALAKKLTAGGYAVLGDAASLLPPAGSGSPDPDTGDDAVLDVAIRLLLDEGEE